MAAYDEVAYQQADPGQAPGRDSASTGYDTGLEADAWALGALDERARIVEQLARGGLTYAAEEIWAGRPYPVWMYRMSARQRAKVASLVALIAQL